MMKIFRMALRFASVGACAVAFNVVYMGSQFILETAHSTEVEGVGDDLYSLRHPWSTLGVLETWGRREGQAGVGYSLQLNLGSEDERYDQSLWYLGYDFDENGQVDQHTLGHGPLDRVGEKFTQHLLVRSDNETDELLVVLSSKSSLKTRTQYRDVNSDTWIDTRFVIHGGEPVSKDLLFDDKWLPYKEKVDVNTFLAILESGLKQVRRVGRSWIRVDE